MVRTLSGVVAGLALAIVSVMSVEVLGNRLYGLSPDMAPGAGAGTAALLFPLAGWFVGTLVGAWLAIRLSRRAWTGWVVAAFIVAAAVLNFLLLRYPAWLMAAGLIAPPLAAWLAQPLAGVRKIASE